MPSMTSTLAVGLILAFAGINDGQIVGPRGANMPKMPEEPLVPEAKMAAEDYCYGLYPPTVPCPIIEAKFDQLIDHNNPNLGTFKQRYWYNAEFYAGPGSPIVLNAPGEEAADRFQWYTTNYTLPGVFAQRVKGAAILMEHRFWGDSSPYSLMTTKNLQLLTLDQAMQDVIRFARKVDLPFTHNTSSPDKSPWIISGGSYPGAVVAWINKLFPGTFWAYHASSAVVQPINNYWQYFQPIDAGMARNCSKDMKLAIKLLDEKLASRDEKGKTALKGKFGLAGLSDDDFGAALTDGLGNWQSTQFYTSKADNKVLTMCDYIEGVGKNNQNNTVVPGEEGVGACKALHGLAKWFREVDIPGNCAQGFPYWKGDKKSVACFDSHNSTSPFFTDRSARNAVNLQWIWMCCNEPFQQWQAYYPGDTGLISKYYTTKDARDQCERYFPDEAGFTYGLKRNQTTEQIVEKTSGWNNIHTTRLIYVNGEFDPWRPETVSSEIRPGGPLASTPEVPVFLVKGGSHCPELVMQNAEVNRALAAQVKDIVSILAKWVGEFYTEKGLKQPGF